MMMSTILRFVAPPIHDRDQQKATHQHNSPQATLRACDERAIEASPFALCASPLSPLSAMFSSFLFPMISLRCREWRKRQTCEETAGQGLELASP